MREHVEFILALSVWAGATLIGFTALFIAPIYLAYELVAWIF